MLNSFKNKEKPDNPIKLKRLKDLKFHNKSLIDGLI